MYETNDHEAMLWHAAGDAAGRVHCDLCAHRCVIADGRRGICHVRENRGGTLYTLVYGELVAQGVDPIEKKPLFHFYPGSTAFSVATPGCNFSCTFCQNADISQGPREGLELRTRHTTPEQVVTAARRAGCASIAYTYTEPTVFFEFAADTMRAAHQANVANVWVTNGYMTEECIDILAPEDPSARLLDAANVDLKAGTEDFYRRAIRRDATPREVVLVGRMCVLAISLIALILALGVKTETILEIVAYAWGGFGAAFGPLVLFALFSKQTSWPAALAGGLTGGLLFHLNNLISVLYVSRMVTTSKIYGSLGLVPVFMIGMYFSWLILLFGGQVAYAWQNRATYLDERQAENINQRGREFVALRLMTCIGERFTQGAPPPNALEIAEGLAVPTRLVKRITQTLAAARLVTETAGAEPAYLPARPLDQITCHDVLLAMRASQGQECATRDEPARAEVYGEFHRIGEAERQAATAVSLQALVNRAQRLKQLPGPARPAAGE